MFHTWKLTPKPLAVFCWPLFSTEQLTFAEYNILYISVLNYVSLGTLIFVYMLNIVLLVDSTAITYSFRQGKSILCLSLAFSIKWNDQMIVVFCVCVYVCVRVRVLAQNDLQIISDLSKSCFNVGFNRSLVLKIKS